MLVVVVVKRFKLLVWLAVVSLIFFSGNDFVNLCWMDKLVF